MIRRRVLQLILVAAAVVAAASPARADEIRPITGGVISTTGPDSASFALLGSGFFLSGIASEGVGDFFACNPCAAGETVGFRSHWSGDIPGPNVVAVDGHPAMSVALAGDIDLDAGTAVVHDTSGSLLFIQRAFSLAPGSFVMGFADAARTIPVFRFGISGSGIVTLTAHRSGSVFTGGSLQWIFSNASPAATPEPGSALLLLTGLGGLTAAWRRKPLAA